MEFKEKNASGWALETQKPEQFAWITFYQFFFSKNSIILEQIQRIHMNTQVLPLFDFLEDRPKVMEHFELNFFHDPTAQK